MQVKRFDPENDFGLIEEICRSHGEPVFPAEVLPETGFFVPGLAAAFLYRTDSVVALIEIMAVHGKAPELRDQALDLVVDEVLFEARLLGARMVVGYTMLPKVVKRAKKHGFQVAASRYQMVIRRV